MHLNICARRTVSPICCLWIPLVDSTSRSWGVSRMMVAASASLDWIFQSITIHVGERPVAVGGATLYVVSEVDGLEGCISK
jgi:hypothetical protein